jgi:hypothetical protein
MPPRRISAPGVSATIDKALTYNLGPTGLRGWIYNKEGDGHEGAISALSRQILVTVASGPAEGFLAVDDVILGAGWGTASEPIPLFTRDTRKSFGGAIGEAEQVSGANRVFHPDDHGWLRWPRIWSQRTGFQLSVGGHGG